MDHPASNNTISIEENRLWIQDAGSVYITELYRIATGSSIHQLSHSDKGDFSAYWESN